MVGRQGDQAGATQSQLCRRKAGHRRHAIKASLKNCPIDFFKVTIELLRQGKWTQRPSSLESYWALLGLVFLSPGAGKKGKETEE